MVCETHKTSILDIRGRRRIRHGPVAYVGHSAHPFSTGEAIACSLVTLVVVFFLLITLVYRERSGLPGLISSPQLRMVLAV